MIHKSYNLNIVTVLLSYRVEVKYLFQFVPDFTENPFAISRRNNSTLTLPLPIVNQTKKSSLISAKKRSTGMSRIEQMQLFLYGDSDWSTVGLIQTKKHVVLNVLGARHTILINFSLAARHLIPS